jgi:hypothetical protein
MATVAVSKGVARDDASFFFKLAAAMGVTVAIAFSLQFAMGRSSFSAPMIVHAHAAAFMAWTGFFVNQSWLMASGRAPHHRRLGWLALPLVAVMAVLGTGVTVAMIQRGQAPFFFTPQYFLISNPLTLLAFILVLSAAIGMRRRSDWHRRLHICAMALIMGPAFGRLLPAPLLMPWTFEICALAGLVFPLTGVARDARAGGVHPAWWWGMAPLPVALVAAALISASPLGGSIYGAVTNGTPGAKVPGLEFPPPPPGFGPK